MHNSNNFAVRKDYFTGTLIAQAKLLGFQTDLNQVKTSELSDIINEQIASKVSTVPMFFDPQVERLELSEKTKETFARIGARARKEFIEEQIARAFQYNIPFDLENINILKLEQQIDEYEELLNEAREQGVDWDISQYDPVALKQEIEEQECYYSQERRDLYSCFAATRGLEV
jgi:hypothetical protein